MSILEETRISLKEEKKSNREPIKKKDGFYPKKVNCSLILKRIIKDKVPVFNEKEVEIKILQNPDAMIWGDIHRLEMIFMNVVQNAVLYNANKGKVYIYIEEETDNHIVIAVEHTGTGIEKDVRQVIFGKFVRGNNSFHPFFFGF